ncbi:helix-hairpin-helix domain-containing protein [Carboxylicivirga sp. RSCT41]|uniref:helix-hairpin-helix domain-containing protein n=1 Tax=Carboxylicivirga agarovorans TaxID=3417570 RepID=UPI003D33098F
MLKRWIVTLGFWWPLFLHAQQTDDLQKMISDMLEAMATQQLENVDYEQVVNDLIMLSQRPVNLNEAQKEDLEQFFFLSDQQIENFLYYRYVNGPLYSVFELQAVEQMDHLTISYLLPFVVTEPVEEKKAKRFYGNVLARVQSTVQTPVGYQAKNDSTEAAYLGSKEKWLMRARFYYGDLIEAGMTLEKDQGEKAFPNYFPVADFSSGFIRFSNPLKYLETVIIGDYRLSFGQGLAVWTDMAFSKTTETAQLRRRPRGINSYTSVNESSFLRGTAVKVRSGNWSLAPFVSYKKRDASFVNDTIDGINVSSLQETGYHRTQPELDNRLSVNERVYGLQSAYRHHLFHVDAGYVNWSIDEPVALKTHLKDKYRFSGDIQETIWLSHAVFLNRLTLFGELAVQNSEHKGIYQGLSYNPGFDVALSVAYRKYSNGYSAILSNPFSESSSRGGESGVFTSLSLSPLEKISLRAYADLFSYDWLRYNVYRPSTGFEWFTQADYRINNYHFAYLRYKSTQKEINSGAQVTMYEVHACQKDNLRLFYAYKPNDKWRFQTQIEQSFYKEGVTSEAGWMAFQDVGFKSGKWTLSGRYIVFDIEDYNSRIYAYEPDVLYAFSIPAYMNKGTKLILNKSIKPVKNLRIWGRLAHTKYANIEELGSGHQLIKGNKLTEWKIQMQYRF